MVLLFDLNAQTTAVDQGCSSTPRTTQSRDARYEKVFFSRATAVLQGLQPEEYKHCPSREIYLWLFMPAATKLRAKTIRLGQAGIRAFQIRAPTSALSAVLRVSLSSVSFR